MFRQTKALRRRTRQLRQIRSSLWWRVRPRLTSRPRRRRKGG
jgi:hypothetical protein